MERVGEELGLELRADIKPRGFWSTHHATSLYGWSSTHGDKGNTKLGSSIRWWWLFCTCKLWVENKTEPDSGDMTRCHHVKTVAVLGESWLDPRPKFGMSYITLDCSFRRRADCPSPKRTGGAAQNIPHTLSVVRNYVQTDLVLK